MRRSLLNILWIGLLLAGLTTTARPVVHRAGRLYSQWTAPLRWERCKKSPVGAIDGEPVVWLTIPKANISTLVTRGSENKWLSRTPCLEILGMATLIMAHRDTHFRGLKNTGPGDRIQLELRDGTRQTYKISDTLIIEAAQAERILQEIRNKNGLILLTCYPFTYIGPAPSRILFIADPV
jgi:LPXTG-site transpeptidase (sortase) family protein